MADFQSKLPLQMQELIQQTQLMRREICCKLGALVAATPGTTVPTTYNNVSQTSLAPSGTATYPTGTVHSINVMVGQGTLTMTLTGGSPVTYPAGTSFTLDATGTFTKVFSFTMSSGVGDFAIIQTVTT